MLPMAAGFLLHLNIVFIQGSGPINVIILTLVGVSILPYAVCAVLLFRFRRDFEAFFGSLFPLMLDIGVYYSVYVDPSHTHAALLYTVAWKGSLFALFPAGLIVGWLASRFVGWRRTNAS